VIGYDLATPEPSSLALIASAAAAVGVVLCRRRRFAMRGGAAHLLVLMLALAPPRAQAAQIFVASLGGNTVGEFDASTGVPINAALISGVNTPEGVIASGGNLFVSSDGNYTVGKYTTSGVTVNAALVSGLGSPNNIAVSGSNLFVSNFGGGTIGEYNAVTGATVNAALITGITNPGGVAMSGSNLFVVTAGGLPGAGAIGEYDATTGMAINAALVTGLNIPEGIVISGSNLFVVNHGTYSQGSYVAGSGSIGEYTTSGATVNAALVSGLNYPRQIAVLGGNLYVTNSLAGTIGEYDATTGAPVNAALVSGLDYPVGIAVVPEPSSLVLMAFAATPIAAAVLRRRRRFSMRRSTAHLTILVLALFSRAAQAQPVLLETNPKSTVTASMLDDVERRGRTEADHILGDLLWRASDRNCSLLRMAYIAVRAAEARAARELGGKRD
jgi:hypothetical protein